MRIIILNNSLPSVYIIQGLLAVWWWHGTCDFITLPALKVNCSGSKLINLSVGQNNAISLDSNQNNRIYIPSKIFYFCGPKAGTNDG